MEKNKSTDLGKYFFIGIPGSELTPKTREHLHYISPAGIILFTNNIISSKQLKTFIESIRSELGYYVLFGIDHEGNGVHRFPDVPAFPGNKVLGDINDPDLAYKQGQCWSQELINTGIDINFAPVLDLYSQGSTPVIYKRCFSADQKITSVLGSHLIQGMQEGGLAATAKHFPGIGLALKDPHNELPSISADETVLSDHIKPFKQAIAHNVALVMTSHVSYPNAFEYSNQPATFSKTITNDLLKDILGYAGCVITDDLEMGSISTNYSVNDTAIKAFNAGNDILLSCKDLEYQKALFDAFIYACANHLIPESRLDGSLKRIQSLINFCQNRNNSKNIEGLSSHTIRNNITQKHTNKD